MDLEQRQSDTILSLTRDLVRLATRTHDLLLKSQIPATHAKEAYEIITVCENIYNEFVLQDKDTSN